MSLTITLAAHSDITAASILLETRSSVVAASTAVAEA